MMASTPSGRPSSREACPATGRPGCRCCCRGSNGAGRAASARPRTSPSGPAALEDLAVVLAEHGQEAAARGALSEAAGLYDALAARWDVRRADSRRRAYGIRRVPRSRGSARPASGWAALSPTEVKVAALIARGDSTSDIARSMFLTRRTVQTYISRMLAKLDAKSRVEIAVEAMRHGATA